MFRLSAISLAALVLLTASGYAQSDSRGIYGAANDPHNTLGTPGQDEDFVHDAMNYSSAEIEWSKLAQQKSSNPEVKEFSKKVVDAEMLVASRLTGEAKSLGVKVPNGLSGKVKKESAKLESLNGPEFDREYLAALVKVQHDDIGNLLQESKQSRDTSLQPFAASTADQVTQRNDAAKALLKQMGAK